tara:strand:- start:173 stop:604 length:432 start_codon:yes stop_codon:yes gene_type:complete
MKIRKSYCCVKRRLQIHNHYITITSIDVQNSYPSSRNPCVCRIQGAGKSYVAVPRYTTTELFPRGERAIISLPKGETQDKIIDGYHIIISRSSTFQRKEKSPNYEKVENTNLTISFWLRPSLPAPANTPRREANAFPALAAMD